VRDRERPRIVVQRDIPQLRVNPTVLDRVVGWFSPARGLSRLKNRAVMDLALRGYEGATTGRRTDGWRTGSRSANAEIGPALTRLRDRCRDLARNNPHAVSAIAGIVSNTNGAGIMPRFDGGSRAVKAVRELWRETMLSTAIDADGRDNFYGLQDLVLRTEKESGEVLVRRRIRRPSDGLRIPLQIQVLEPDHIDTAKIGTTASGNQVIQGIEFNKLGQRVAYWLFRDHPGENILWRNRSSESERVDASEILHIFTRQRPGQARGVPQGVAVILRARNWDEYCDATLQKQIVAACYAAFEIHMDGAGPEAPPAGQDQVVDSLESGTVQQLGPGKDIKFASPPPVGDLKDFASVSLHEIAAGWKVPYELMTGDYSDTNYSSARMAWNEFGRQVENWRWKLIVPQFCQPVLDWWLEAAMLAGELPAPVTVEWRAPRKELLDPTKEVPAIRAAVRSGLMSLDQALAEQGEDPDQVLEEIARTNDKLDKLKLILDTDPRKVTLSGIIQSADVPDSEQNVVQK
jgi:lambda family phage portal protein